MSARRKERRPSEGARLAQANAEMKFALANNCTILEARNRMAQLRWRATLQAQDYRRERTLGFGQRQPVELVSTTFWWERD